MWTASGADPDVTRRADPGATRRFETVGHAGHGGPLAIGQNFGARYHVIRLLGIGGMGAVYQAWDQVLEVAVAIKVIRIDPSIDPLSAADLEKRFKRELLLARQVTHKNVVRIHDLGEIDGIKYITMPYIQGADLSSVLRKEGRLSLSRALAIARQVVSGLVAAHEAGVVHRDLKPANIMLDVEEHACVMDFGIARSTSGAAGFAMTMAGAVVGTVEYMAPEQAKGETVDQRADVYALGLILRDMLLGLRHHGAGTAMSELMARMQQAPASLRTVDPQIPVALDEIVTRCLQPDPAARYQTTQDLLAALERLGADGHAVVAAPVPQPATPVWRKPGPLAAVALLVLMVVAGYWFSKPGSAPPPVAIPDEPVSVAVLPFQNSTRDPALDSLGPSLAEVLLSELGQTEYLRTVPSDRLYQVLSDLKVGNDASPDALKRIAELTNADVVVHASYVQLGSQIRLTGKLHNLKRGSQVDLSAEAPNEEALLTAVDKLAADVRSNIVSGDTAQKLNAAVHAQLSRSMEAVRAYTDGLALARQSKHDEAIERFKAAAESDTGFALAHARMAMSYDAAGYGPEAQRAAAKAIELSAAAPPADRFFILATDASIRGDGDKAVEYYKQLVDAAPSDVAMRFEYARLLEDTGDLDGAREQLKRVLSADPKYVNALLAAGRVEIRRGSPQTSLDMLNSALTLSIQLENDHVRANVLQAIGVAYKRLDRPEDALRHYNESLEIKRRVNDKAGMAASLSEIAQMQTRLGKRREALTSYQEAERIRREIGDRAGLGNTLIDLGTFYLEQGRYDDALKSYGQSLQIQRELGNDVSAARALNNIGSAYFEKGQYDDALTNFEGALAIREKRGTPSEVSETLHNIGETHVRVGRFGRALDQYLRALELARKAGETRTAAIESYSIGIVFEYQGRYGAALQSREEAYEQFRKLNERSFWYAEIMAGYGRSLMLAGHLEPAQKTLGEALQVARDQGNQAVVARVLTDEGERLRMIGDLAGARRAFDEVGSISREIGDRFLIVRTQVNQALLATVDPRRAAAAAATLATLAGQAEAQGLKALAVEAALGRAEALLTTGQAAAAGAEAQRALTRAENLGMRMLQARAHYVAARAAQTEGAAAPMRRHFTEVRRILEEAAREPKADQIGRRADIAEMLSTAAAATK